ncbi:MAG: DinB family protein [Deinococcales bacterium]
MLSDGVKEAWQINSRINKVIIDHLSPEMVHARTPGGGWSVAQHLAEIVMTPKHFGSKFNASLAKLPNLYEDNPDDFIAETDLNRIREVTAQTAEAVLAAAETAQSKGDLPHNSLDAYLIHMMVHDAHHRGQLLLALKTNGFPLPSEDLMWKPWKAQG